MGFLSKKSESKQQAQSTNESGNHAFDQISQGFGDTGAATFNNSNESIMDLLGLNGDNSQDSGFQKFLESSGFGTILDTGSRAITGNAASQGWLNSGATGKRLTEFGQDLGRSSVSDYIQNLFNLQKGGLGAGQLVAGTGNYSRGQSTSSGTSTTRDGSGIAGALGSVGAGFAASDIRLKTDIVEVGQFSNGLTVYDFTYKATGDKHTGVMVHEVEALCPEALGPEVFGYGTVNYTKLEEMLGEPENDCRLAI